MFLLGDVNWNLKIKNKNLSLSRNKQPHFFAYLKLQKTAPQVGLIK